jgi:hypothetical protein
MGCPVGSVVERTSALSVLRQLVGGVVERTSVLSVLPHPVGLSAKTDTARPDTRGPPHAADDRQP